MISDLEKFDCCSGGTILAAIVTGTVPHAGAGFKLSKPSRMQILAAEREAFDKIWYCRHIEMGRQPVGEASAAEIERTYGKDALDICEDCLLRLEELWAHYAGLRTAPQ